MRRTIFIHLQQDQDTSGQRAAGKDLVKQHNASYWRRNAEKRLNAQNIKEA